MKKKILCYFLTIMTFMQGLVIPISAADVKRTGNVAEIKFSQNPEKLNIGAATMGLNSTPVVADRDGEPCWVMDVLNGDNSKFINISFADGFVDTAGTATYDVEVDYYDYGQGYFTYWYDSKTNDNQYGNTFYFEDERVWKTAKFEINDADFKRGIDNLYDFRLSITIPVSTSSGKSAASAAIKRIKVTRNDNKNPIYVDSTIDEAGAAFEWYKESKIIHDHFENRTDKTMSVNVRRVAVAEETQAVLFDETESISFEPYEKKMVDFDFGKYDQCEQYEYKIYITSEEYGINSEFTPIRFAVIKTDPNKIKNRAAYLNTAIWNIKNPLNLIEIADKVNIGGVRIPAFWWHLEPTSIPKGTYAFGGVMEETTALLSEKNIDILPIIGCMSFHYTAGRSESTFPASESEMKAWRGYVNFAAETFTKYGVNQYEIWNEPDVHNGVSLANGDVMGGRTYIPVYNAALEEIKAVNPNAKVMGAGTCWASSSDIFLAEALENGLADTLDVFSGHPYYRQQDEISNAVPSLTKWKNEIAKYGGKEDIETWATECGLTTADSDVSTIENQGNWLARKLYWLPANNAADCITIFSLDGRGMCEYNREDKYGLTAVPDAPLYQNTNSNMPYSPLLKIAAECYVLADATPTEKIYEVGENLVLCEYKSNKFNADVLTLNTITEKRSLYETVTLNLGCEKIDYYDEFGNMSTLYGDNGLFTFTADERPHYIVGNFNGVEVVENNQIAEYSKNVINSSKGDITEILVRKPEGKNYQIVTECGAGLEVIENNGFSGNEASVKVKVDADKDTYAYVTMKVMDGEKTVQQSDVKILSKEPVVTDITSSLITPGDYNSWMGEILIENTSVSSAVKGKVRFTYPKNFATLAPMDIGIIPRSRTGRVKFMLPKIIEKGEYTIEYDIVLDSGEVIPCSSKLDFTVASKVETKPKIDGIIEDGEWNMDTAMYVNKASQAKTLIKTEPWRGEKDLSGKMVVEWDENNFYFMAEIQDDVYFHQEAENAMYKDDSIQIGVYYGKQGYIVAGQGALTYHELTLGNSTKGPIAYRHLSQDNSYEKGVPENFEIGITRNGNKTYYEFMIPWKNLLKEGQQPVAGNQLGFSALVNENDGTGRRGWLEYASGIGESKNTALFTYIKLYE